MVQKTLNLNLNKPEVSDIVGDTIGTHIPENMDILDATIHNHTSAASPHIGHLIAGTLNTDINRVKALELKTDTRSVQLTYTNGQLTTVKELDGTTVVKTTNLAYDTNGNLIEVQETAGGTIVTTTLTYTNGVLTSIAKAVT